MKLKSFAAGAHGLFAFQVIAVAASLPLQTQSSIHVTAGKFVSKAAHVSRFAETIKKAERGS